MVVINGTHATADICVKVISVNRNFFVSGWEMNVHKYMFVIVIVLRSMASFEAIDNCTLNIKSYCFCITLLVGE